MYAQKVLPICVRLVMAHIDKEVIVAPCLVG